MKKAKQENKKKEEQVNYLFESIDKTLRRISQVAYDPRYDDPKNF